MNNVIRMTQRRPHLHRLRVSVFSWEHIMLHRRVWKACLYFHWELCSHMWQCLQFPCAKKNSTYWTRAKKKKQWHNSRTVMRRKLVSNNHPLYEVINGGHCLGGLDQLTTDRYICIFIVKAREKTVFSAPRLLYVHKADVDGLLCRQTWLKHGAYPGRQLGWAAHFMAVLTSSRREKIEEKQEQKALISMAAIAQPFNNDTR